MKNWLIQKEQEQKNLFQDLIEISIGTLKDFNEQEKKEIYVRVIFSKDDWLDGKAELEFLQKNSDGDYNTKDKYTHSVYNTNKDIHSNSILCKLMSKGLFTNAWFSILDTSRKYDTTFILTDKEYLLENDNCEYRENRMKETHTGFNVISPQEKKNRI
jgi:hypothetical protein